MSSDDSEYSEWNGFSPQDSPDNTITIQKPNDEGSSESNEGGESLQRGAKDFKAWAREQSGLGDSISNISSLPQILPEQRQAMITSAKKIEHPSISTDIKKLVCIKFR